MKRPKKKQTEWKDAKEELFGALYFIWRGYDSKRSHFYFLEGDLKGHANHKP